MKMLPCRAFVLLSALSALCVLPLSSRGEPPMPPGAAKVLRDVAYVPDGQARQRLDLYLPVKPAGPLLVYIHGGGWRGGSKNLVQGLPMLGQGYAVASVEYRFSQDAIFPAQIEDCKAAIRWLRAHAAENGYDPKRVAAMGESAGGHLTALLATTGDTHDFDKGENLDQSSAIQCGIDFYGPTDFPSFVPPSDIPAVQRTGDKSLFTQFFGGPMDEKMDLAKRASPVTWVSKNSAPLFILHGTKDPLVPVSQSKELEEKLKEAGVEVKLDVIEGAGHGGKEFGANDRPKEMVEFLNNHLMPAAATKG
jgi:acetyl esterase/lipase